MRRIVKGKVCWCPLHDADQGMTACSVQDHRRPEPADDAFPFLDGLRVYLACCALDEQAELASICLEGGACRYVQLEALITHIVVSPAVEGSPARPRR